MTFSLYLRICVFLGIQKNQYRKNIQSASKSDYLRANLMKIRYNEEFTWQNKKKEKSFVLDNDTKKVIIQNANNLQIQIVCIFWVVRLAAHV